MAAIKTMLETQSTVDFGFYIVSFTLGSNDDHAVWKLVWAENEGDAGQRVEDDVPDFDEIQYVEKLEEWEANSGRKAISSGILTTMTPKELQAHYAAKMEAWDDKRLALELTYIGNIPDPWPELVIWEHCLRVERDNRGLTA